MQVLGSALLPGAAMIELASSAGALLLSRTGAGVPLPATIGGLTLVGVSIPAPLLLTSPGDGVLSVSVDGGSGRCAVQSHMIGEAARTMHLVCSSAFAAMQPVAHSARPVASDESQRAATAAVLTAGGAQPKWDQGTAVAQLCPTWAGQSEQYRVHPAVLDNCTQVRCSSRVLHLSSCQLQTVDQRGAY